VRWTCMRNFSVLRLYSAPLAPAFCYSFCLSLPGRLAVRNGALCAAPMPAARAQQREARAGMHRGAAFTLRLALRLSHFGTLDKVYSGDSRCFERDTFRCGRGSACVHLDGPLYS